jgi:predicted RNA-binding Zn-ribbon protein involved in translation (DUF1610 family)
MSFSIPISALVLYPFLYLLPLNLVRFRWGFEEGLAPMPPEVQEKAEAADRVVLCVTHVILLVTIVLLMRGSPISQYDVGLTANNWKSALGMGILFSLFPLGLSELLLRNMPTEKVRKETESHEPVAAWYGLNTLGSFTQEFWRAFCIVSLIRAGLSTWVAVLIVAAVYGTLHLQTSVARALGSAAFGGAAGFLFVNTGSLLAPLTMSLLVAGANLYQVRQASTLSGQTSGNQRVQGPLSRSSSPCPACGAGIPRSDFHRRGDSFPCPTCGEWLTYDLKYVWAMCAVCFVAAPYATWRMGYRDAAFIFIAYGGAILLSFANIFLQALLVPARYKRARGAFVNKLTMFATDKTDSNNKPDPQ